MNKFLDLDNTNFIFETHLAGDPTRDKFRSKQKYANVIIPDIQLARQMIDDGFKVKMTKPRDGEEEGFTPRYYLKVIVNYNRRNQPIVHLVQGRKKVELFEDTINMLDNIKVQNVSVRLDIWDSEDYGKIPYVDTMYVEQAIREDPFASRYCQEEEGDYRAFNGEDDIPEELPWERNR